MSITEKSLSIAVKKITELIDECVLKEIRDLRTAVDDLSKQNVALSGKVDLLLEENRSLKDIVLQSAITREPVGHLVDNCSLSPDMFSNEDDGHGYSNAVKRPAKPRLATQGFSFPVTNKYQLLSVMKEVTMMEEKRNNAVVVGYPEQKDREKATKEHDEQAMTGFLRKAGINMSDIIEIKRHGQQRVGRHRPLKILTHSHETRETIITAFNKFRPADAPRTTYCRRDMTPTELEEDRRLRSLAYEQNVAEGKKMWTVRNLELLKLKLKEGQEYEEFVARPDNKKGAATIP
jgi:hypothetical protein